MATCEYILIVEDDEDIREALTQILELEGYRVQSAGNGRAALDITAVEGAPCLILLDLMMPVMDGWQFRVEQLKEPRLASVPVVVISADAGVDQKAASLGAASVLPKPISLDKLLQAVETHCSAHASPSE